MADPSKSPRTAFRPPPTLIPTPAGGVPNVIPGDSQGVDNDVTDHLKVQLLVRAYQVPSPMEANIRSEDTTKPKSIRWG
jgi:2-oxoglutarate dehydrogenase E1 component